MSDLTPDGPVESEQTFGFKSNQSCRWGDWTPLTARIGPSTWTWASNWSPLQTRCPAESCGNKSEMWGGMWLPLQSPYLCTTHSCTIRDEESITMMSKHLWNSNVCCQHNMEWQRADIVIRCQVRWREGLTAWGIWTQACQIWCSLQLYPLRTRCAYWRWMWVRP